MYRIGELAKLFNVKPDTLRFYEKNGLLIPSARSEASYRLYTEVDRAKLQFILRCKQVGFSLADIEDLLAIRVDKSRKTCMDVKEIADGKLRDIADKIRVLEQFQRSLKALSCACCGGPESAEHCSIMESLEVFANQDQKAHHCDCPSHHTDKAHSHGPT